MTNCTVYVDSTTAQVKIGGNASSNNNPEQKFGAIKRIGGSTSTPELRLSGVKGQNIFVEYVEYAMIWASTTAGVRYQEYCCAYSNLHFKYCFKLELATDPLNASGAANSNEGGSIQWINENNFYLNRINTLIVGGSYNHNHNRFFAGTFEGTSYITFNSGRDNRMYGERFEGLNCVVTFGQSTERNIIINTFDDSEYNGGPEATTINIVDNGIQNAVVDDFRLYYKTETVATADISEVVLNNEVGDVVARQPYLQCIQGSSGHALVISDFLFSKVGVYIFYSAYGADTGDTYLYRPFITFYDKDFNKLTPLASWVYSSTMTAILGNDIQTSIGVNSGVCRITQGAIDAGAMFFKVGWKASNAQLANGLARKLLITASSVDKHSTTPLAVANMFKQPKLVSSIPTKGYAPAGYSVMDKNGLYRYNNKFALSTTASAVTDASHITVTTVTGVAVGDVIGINLSDRTTHWTTVAAVSGSDLTLTTAAGVLPVVGCRVVFNRWATETI